MAIDSLPRVAEEHAIRQRLGARGSERFGVELLITEVTEMHGGTYCVAGWCFATGNMIRPLPNGGNWSESLLRPHGVAPGVVLHVQPNGMQPDSTYPHRTEDTPIDPAGTKLVKAGPRLWSGFGAPPAAATLNDAFQGHIGHNSLWNGVLHGAYVPIATRTRSLYAIAMDCGRLQLFEDGDHLRAYLDDGSGRYNISISCRQLKELHRRSGLNAVKASLPSSGRLHVRVGLAREWGKYPGKCFVMINGIHW